jgi:hypothetical protein
MINSGESNSYFYPPWDPSGTLQQAPAVHEVTASRQRESARQRLLHSPGLISGPIVGIAVGMRVIEHEGIADPEVYTYAPKVLACGVAFTIAAGFAKDFIQQRTTRPRAE